VSAGLGARWRALAGANAEDLGARLISAYCEPHRRYHGLSHIAWLLDEAERARAAIADPDLIGFAIWFHDAIYDPKRTDNEARSAEWALTALMDRGDLGARVARLVAMTKRHAEGEASADEALFLDMDVAILGSPRAEYCVYAAGVRAEYGHLPDPTFAAGRAAFLDGQLVRDRLFRTDGYEQRLAREARTNMRWEMGEMRKGRMVRV